MSNPSTAVDRREPIALQADVLVVGGGAAGVAAAVTAARRGLKVTLVERYGFCGGGAVAGLSGTICGMYEASDDPNAPPNQIVHGFLDEFAKQMTERGGLTPPVRYGKTFTRVHDPLIWRETADAMLRAAGVQLLLHTTVTDALVEGGEKIDGITAYTKQGRLSVRAKLTIDASGDADVAAMAGFPTFIGQDGKIQNPTMIFRLGGVDTEKFLSAYGPDSIMGREVTELILRLHNSHKYRLPRAKIFLFPTPRPNELLCNCTRVIGRDGRELNPLLVEDITEAEIEGRLQVREYARFFRDHLAGCEESFVNDTGVQVGVRQTRQLLGRATLRNEDVTRGSKFASGIARSPWPIELHSGDKPRLVWLTNDYYEVPLDCFVPERGEGLFAAGRCLSAEHEAMASARVTAQCFSYGHAVGHAAAIAVKDKLPPRAVDAAEVRQRLNRDGALL
jgi:glycine/D-amino acid oxidase-like deaminating enzyme